MKLDRLVLTAFSPAFPGTVDLVLRDLEPGVIAVVGGNGAGKTTLLGAAPAAVYRQTPGDGDDPVTFATSRESSVVLEYTTADAAYRSTLSLDGPKRKSNALLEQWLPHGPWSPLNDGKLSTYDEVVRRMFPSFDLFINSSFAAQGRGDEFTRRKPSQRKDLFAEFLGQQHYAVMSRSAAAAADLCADSKLRLEAQADALVRDTSGDVLAALDRAANELQAAGGTAEARKRALVDVLATLETQQATASDQVAAYAAATDRVRVLERDQAANREDRDRVESDKVGARRAHEAELQRIDQKCEADVTAAASSIAKNQQVLEHASDIRAAVAAIATVSAELATLRTRLTAEHAEAERVTAEDAAIARQEQVARVAAADAARARRDTAILSTVPCGGTEAFAGCKFLVNAVEAQRALPTYDAAAAPLLELEATGERLRAAYAAARETVNATMTSVRVSEAALMGHRTLADYEAPLAAAEARIAEWTAAQGKATADAAEQRTAAAARLDARLQELDTRWHALMATAATLEADLTVARAHLEATKAGNDTAVVLQAQLRTARTEWDTVTATLARVESQQADLARRRETLAAQRVRLVDVTARLRRVEQAYLEWLDLAKAFAKGGLPDLEIDAAGPTISSITNDLLSHAFGPRFTCELVTQVDAAAGGMKDEFTVRVVDNEAATPEWRDIRKFSGGQKTILQEALMSAISLYVNERSPMPIRTLWRDETGAALDGENALRYVQMLRRIREIGGYVHVFFVSHNLAAANLADVQIRVGDGRAEIVRPPFEAAA